jgi:hypothetical protein
VSVPGPRWSAITIDCAQPRVVADFWAALLGGQLNVPLPGWRRLRPPDPALPMLNFQPVPEPKTGKARIHLDLTVDDVDAAIGRVLELGGRTTGERHDYDEGVVVVLADPEGNEFCVVRYFVPPA